MSIFAFAIIALGITFWLSRRPGMSEGMKKVWQIMSVILLSITLTTLVYALFLVT